MAGQGRNADGLIGSEPRDAVNVVRFPGDWFGPLGDLVPIGTDADSERDEQDRYGDDPDGLVADSFWSEDAEAAHRVGTAASTFQRGARARPLRVVLPLGVAAVVAVVLAVALIAGGHAGWRGRILHAPKDRPAAARLAAAPPLKAPRVTPGSAKRGGGDRKHAKRDGKHPKRVRVIRHPAHYRTSLAVAARPHIAVTDVSSDVSVNSAPSDRASPTGFVSPPPDAAQANP
jgi:hypothetical protein